jgi:hypothetical protein
MGLLMFCLGGCLIRCYAMLLLGFGLSSGALCETMGFPFRGYCMLI